MSINDAVASRILQLMKEKGMTQYRLEQNSGIAHGAMDRILNSQNRTVTLTTIYRLATGFDMTALEFLDCEIFRDPSIELY